MSKTGQYVLHFACWQMTNQTYICIVEIINQTFSFLPGTMTRSESLSVSYQFNRCLRDATLMCFCLERRSNASKHSAKTSINVPEKLQLNRFTTLGCNFSAGIHLIYAIVFVALGKDFEISKKRLFSGKHSFPHVAEDSSVY